jgi:hypothetical protein
MRVAASWQKLGQVLMSSLCPCSKPLGYAGKPEVPERWKGKQMATAAPKEGKTLDAYFEKKYNWIADVRVELLCRTAGTLRTCRAAAGAASVAFKSIL